MIAKLVEVSLASTDVNRAECSREMQEAINRLCDTKEHFLEWLKVQDLGEQDAVFMAMYPANFEGED